MEKVIKNVTFNEDWLYKLDDSSLLHSGVHDHAIEFSSDDDFVNIPQSSFEFMNVNFHFILNL